MKSNEKLKKYIPLVYCISSACCNAFEVVLHDTKNPKQSVVAIKNGHLSGRKIGDAMTDLAINLVNTNEHMRKHFISNYEGRLKNGKIFLSATSRRIEAAATLPFSRYSSIVCSSHTAISSITSSAPVSTLPKSIHPSENRDFSSARSFPQSVPS